MGRKSSSLKARQEVRRRGLASKLPYNVSSPIGTVAAAHVCASVPNFLVIEFHGHVKLETSFFGDGP